MHKNRPKSKEKPLKYIPQLFSGYAPAPACDPYQRRPMVLRNFVCEGLTKVPSLLSDAQSRDCSKPVLSRLQAEHSINRVSTTTVQDFQLPRILLHLHKLSKSQFQITYKDLRTVRRQ